MLVFPQAKLIPKAPTRVTRETNIVSDSGGCAGAGASAANHLLPVVGVCAEAARTTVLTITHKSTSRPWQVARTYRGVRVDPIGRSDSKQILWLGLNQGLSQNTKPPVKILCSKADPIILPLLFIK